MSRLQLALNVSDLDAAVAFYTNLFGIEPAKRYPGYANFAIAEPPLKLVLIENAGATERLNHLGVEVFTQAEVVAEHQRLTSAGMTARVEDNVTCCYAVQDKFWVDGPDVTPWEVYTVLAPAETMGPVAAEACCVGDQPSCCAA
ncbi:MAG: VOC family protein [Chloroflexi bacterium]|nr:VOC family protein [Chloroflexota bacterium]